MTRRGRARCGAPWRRALMKRTQCNASWLRSAPGSARLIVSVPDVGIELPASADLVPQHHIFAGDRPRRVVLGLEAEDADLAGIIVTQGQHLDHLGLQLG